MSKPYYNFFLHSFGLPLLLLMGIGPLVAWRRASLRALGKTFVIPAVAALVTGVALIAVGLGSSTPGLLAYTFSAFVLASIVLEFVRGTPRHRLALAARRARTGAGTAATSFTRRCSCSRSGSPARARTRRSASAV